MEPTIIGIIGCGNISDAYLKGAARSELIRVKACADMRPEAAEAKAEEYGVAAVPVDALLGDPEIEIVINLTVPLAHGPVSRQIITAGKHVYSEKPLAARFSEGQALMLAAAGRGVRVGCAPDTFLGAAHQACRRAVDAGRIGRPVAGAASVMSHGMEHWHPNPEFFFKRGGGPILDIGPYYVTQLVNLLGPVARGHGAGLDREPDPHRDQRAAQRPGDRGRGADHGQWRAVVRRRRQRLAQRVLGRLDAQALPFEIYGTEGSLLVPDPNFFGGAPLVRTRRRMAGARQSGASVRPPEPQAAQRRQGRRLPDHRPRSTWPRRSARAGPIAPTATWRCTCSRSWTRSSAPRSKAATS